MDTLTSTNTWTKACPPRLAPPELAAAVAEQIRAHGHKWRQDAWWDGFPDVPLQSVTVIEAQLRDIECTTTACVAGWAIALGAPVGTMLTTRPVPASEYPELMVPVEERLVLPGSTATMTIPAMAAVLLGLPSRPPGSGTHWLFRAERELGEVLAALDKIARGKPATAPETCSLCGAGLNRDGSCAKSCAGVGDG